MARDERPYVVLYRAEDKRRPGEIRKGRRTFRTRAEQARFIRDAPWDYAITYYN